MRTRQKGFETRSRWRPLVWLAALALVVAACGPGAQPDAPLDAEGDVSSPGEEAPAEVPVEGRTITMWHWETPPHRVAVTEEIAERFKQETGITLQQIAINFPDYTTRMLAAIQAGDLPDMIQVNPPTFMTLMAHDAIIPVTDLFQDIHSQVDFFEAGYRDYELHGENWGIPVFGVLFPLLYRADLYDEIGMPEGPVTWDDLLQATKQLHDPANSMFGMGLPVSTNGNYGSQVVWGFVAGNGGAVVECIDGEERVVFNSSETVEAYRFLAELAELSPPGNENWAWAEAEMSVKAGTVGTIVFTGSWLQATHGENPELAAKYRFAAIPTRESGMQSFNTGYVRNITITTAAEENGNLDAVETWLRWITEPDNHAEYLFMEPGTFMSPSRAVLDSPVWSGHALNQQYAGLIDGQAEAMGRVATIGFSNECSSLLAGAYEGSFTLAGVLQKIVLQGWTAEDAVTWGHEQFERILAEDI